jgi:hypothetical protein
LESWQFCDKESGVMQSPVSAGLSPAGFFVRKAALFRKFLPVRHLLRSKREQKG